MGRAVYRALLRLLPSAFRREYADEMEGVVEEHWRAVRAGAGLRARTRFWGRQLWAVVKLAATLRWRAAGRAVVGPGTPRLPGGGDDGGGSFVEGLWLDVRHVTRSLAKRPGFTLVTVATLGLGIGASTALFSAVHAVLLRDLPYQEPDRIVAVFHEDASTGERGGGMSAANARDLDEAADLLSAVAVAEPYSQDMELDGRAESLRAWAVSEGFFEAVGVEPRLGRVFLSEEYAPDGPAVAILGHDSWVSRFGADPGLVGRTVTLDGEATTIVGVLPAGFRLPADGELWIPRPHRSWDSASRAADFMTGFARLAPGATLEGAAAEASRVAASLAEAHPSTSAALGFRLVPLRDHLFGEVRAPLMILMGAVGFALLIACANVAGLMLARGAARRREYALRGALGASRGQLVRHVTVESVLLAGAGCLLGIALTWFGVHVIRGLGPDHLPRIDELRVDRVVLAFAVAAAGLSALLSGLAPSLRLSRPDLGEMLGQGGRGATGSRRGLTLRNRLVVGEVAAAVVLLVGAGLLFRSFGALLDEELGFEPENRLAVQIFAYGYEDAADLSRFLTRATDRIGALPGVRGVALTSSVPGATDGTIAAIDVDLPFTVVDRPAPPVGREPRAWSNQVSADYFDVMEIPVLAGRSLLRSDDADAPRVAVVNEALVRRHIPDRDPIGTRLRVGTGERAAEWEIVGVVADVRQGGYESEPRPEIYRSLGQAPTGSLTFVIEAATDAASLTEPAMQAIWEANPSQSIWGASTVEGLLADWLRERRFTLLLLGSFAAIALLLAAVGVYGLVAFSVEQRVAELGIRKALGGRSATILGMVLAQGAAMAGAGVALGVVGALVLTRFLQGMLFGVEATDPATFVVLSLSVLAVACVATLVPALRAVGVDPVVALREDP